MQSSSSINIRPATEDDIPFLVEAIIEAEKSGTDKLSYSTLFEIPEEQIRTALAEIIAEDVPGQELSISSFLIAESNGKRVGTLAAWVEDKERSSASLKGILFGYYLPKESIEKALQKREVLEEINFDRKPGTIQIECVYTVPEFRGMGIVSMLIAEHINLLTKDRPEVKITQVQVGKYNEAAVKAYIKAGYKIIGEKVSANPMIKKWFPSDSRVLLEKNI